MVNSLSSSFIIYKLTFNCVYKVVQLIAIDIHLTKSFNEYAKAKLLINEQYKEFWNLIKFMLEKNLKIEQEAFLI
jgi:hypothetical protein